MENLGATDCWSLVLNLANDWVPTIRAEAKRIAQEWLKDATFEQFSPHALALNSLRLKQRENHAPFIESHESWLTKDCHIDLLIKAIENVSHQKFSRYSFYLLERTALPEDRLIKLGLGSSDVVTNGKMLMRICSFSLERKSQYMTLLLDSSRDLYRWYGLDFLSKSKPEQAKLRSLDFLLSTYSALRDKAHSLSGLSKLEISDIAWSRIQQANLKSDHVCVGLYLLSQNPKDVYLPVVNSCLDHKSHRVQAAALLALSKLAPEIAEKNIMGAILSDKPILGRAAIVTANILQIQVTDEQWMNLVRQSSSEVSASRTLDWSRSFGRWVALAVLLEFAKIRPEFKNLYVPYLRLWVNNFNSSWSVINEKQKRWIERNLDVIPSLGQSIKQIEFYLN